MELNSLGFLTPSQQTQESSASLADNFDDFLLLLTTQLQNQDPLEPLDPNEFTSQLVEFSSVEQLIAQTARLDSLITLQQSNQVADAVSFVGKTVEVIGDTVAMVDGQAQINYELTSAASGVNVVIRDAAGQVVRTLQGDNGVGSHQVVWDGLNDQGAPQPDGPYTFEINAIDEDGEATLLNTSIEGVVDGVSNAEGTLVITIGGVSYPLADVLSVRDTNINPGSEPQA
ncbi:MAG: flagellar hook capping FlgD N-terminal domain-containing protein [Alphaproteobacteria bacterium]|nr:flagellar hook capping FlgD N-terminal domain-containing protein [Alphaproteobacteria bacterium]